ncbi:MAG: 50S ribosomal protein L18 [Sedimentisphaerales bacterium]|nr:50S ribosomal protein L18 [Sedimentisphaerales bacterium]
MDKNKSKNVKSIRRKRRVRKSVYGDPDRPRLAVFRSLRHMYAQIIDDDNGATLVSASTLDKALESKGNPAGNIAAAAQVGELLARKALAVGIHQVRFDRKGYKYHGRVKALAEGARKEGLVF